MQSCSPNVNIRLHESICMYKSKSPVWHIFLWACLFGFCFIFSVVQKLFICGKLWRWSLHGPWPQAKLINKPNVKCAQWPRITGVKVWAGARATTPWHPDQHHHGLGIGMVLWVWGPFTRTTTATAVRAVCHTQMWARKRTHKIDIHKMRHWTFLQVQVGLESHCSRLDFLRIPATCVPSGFRSRALAVSLSSAGSQLAAIWLANYLHIKKSSTMKMWFSLRDIFWGWDEMGKYGRRSRSVAVRTCQRTDLLVRFLETYKIISPHKVAFIFLAT